MSVRGVLRRVLLTVGLVMVVMGLLLALGTATGTDDAARPVWPSLAAATVGVVLVTVATVLGRGAGDRPGPTGH